MEVLTGFDARPTGPSVATIGAFAVVHIGHQALIERATQAAESAGAVPTVVTFDRHPLEVVRPEAAPCRLWSTAQRLARFEELGIGRVLLVPFSREVSELTPREFVSRVLVESLACAHVVVGQDFRFGHDRAGDPQVLSELGAELGFTVEVAPLVGGDQKVSTSEVRRLVLEGDVSGAAALLGASHRIAGTVVRGDGRGREIGFPTANLEPPERTCLPAAGIYAGWWVEAGRRLPGAVYVGDKPTLEGTSTGVEIHVFDLDEDLYGREAEIEFTTRLRGDRAFPSIDELVEQMRLDVAEARRVLASAP
ncbi:MAG TPA: bifunctional riboflavin kinase/FAD synthetase [Actinomycetota bacterium]|nr:bifunctional riboflavin kinase/FAD synthetase [Actinomycetota bacterium]